MHTHDISGNISALLDFRPDNGIYIAISYTYTGIYLLESSKTSKYISHTVLN